MRISDWSSDVCSSDLDELATATETIAGSRDQMVAAVDALVELATLTNDTVIEPHAERLTALLEQVRPLLGTLAERSDILATRSEEHTSELQSLMRISYAVFCFKKKQCKNTLFTYLLIIQ